MATSLRTSVVLSGRFARDVTPWRSFVAARRCARRPALPADARLRDVSFRSGAVVVCDAPRCTADDDVGFVAGAAAAVPAAVEAAAVPAAVEAAVGGTAAECAAAGGCAVAAASAAGPCGAAGCAGPP
ncbi:MAG TPA: hypothetical protein VNT54_14250, partial [Solirubrobacteraceae bacterium]|nr:hypothetical protein [Solirubrobacteraceae bacterium]